MGVGRRGPAGLEFGIVAWSLLQEGPGKGVYVAWEGGYVGGGAALDH